MHCKRDSLQCTVCYLAGRDKSPADIQDAQSNGLAELLQIVACHEVTGGNLLKLGHAFCTGIRSVGAAGTEGAAGRCVQGRGDVTGENNALVFSCLMGSGRGTADIRHLV